MKPGIKIGLKGWRERLEKSQAKYAEVYFTVSNYQKYEPIFSYLKKKGVNFGLHFWAKVKGDYLPNLVFKGPVAEESRKYIRQTLDIAAKAGAHYVNIHPGSFRLRKIYFKGYHVRIEATNETIDPETGKREFLKNCQSLNQYAQEKNVLLLVETVCRRDKLGWFGDKTLKSYRSYNVDSETLYELAKEKGIYLTNDFGHTLTESKSKTPQIVFNALYRKTKKLAPFTKLIHSNTALPVFNGVDSHLGLLDNDFENKKAFPNKEQIISLFRLFKDRPDVWVVPEPLSNHLGNFKALKKILKDAKRPKNAK